MPSRHAKNKTRPASHRPARPPRPFQFEELEPRLLLSADLTGSVFSTTLGDPSVPTNAETAIVRVVNEGSAKVSKATQIEVYASTDANLGAGDVLLGTAMAPRTLASGAGTNVSVPLVIPSGLAAGTYQLLTRVDATDLINERDGESNNVAVGPNFDVVWQFGAVPGRSGNTILSLVDPDGTLVRFSLTGPGTGTVTKDGTAWDVLVAGSTAATQFALQTTGGNGRTVLDDVVVTGQLAALAAPGGELAGTLAVDGSLGSLQLARIAGGAVAADSLALLNVGGAVDQATLLVGTRLGSDHQPGGTGSAADTYSAGTLGSVNIAGAVTASVLRIGQDPVNGSFDDGDDITLSGVASSVGAVTVGGTMALDSRFVAGAFPVTASIAGANVSTAGDPRFVLNLDLLTLRAGLQSDTGNSSTDLLTRDPAVAGTLDATAPLLSFTARVDGSAAVDVANALQADGRFALPAAQLELILGSTLGDGAHTVWLFANDAAGNQASTTVSFELDRTTPSPLSLTLSPASDTQTVGDGITTAALVDLMVQTEAGAALSLLQTDASGTAGAFGGFVFQAVPLSLGSQSFTLRATDAAGNEAERSLLLRRASAPVLQPVPAIAADEQTPINFSLQAADADNGTLSFAIDGTLPDGASFDTGTGQFAWTPGEAAGPGYYSFDVTVSDNDTPALGDRQTVNITVQEVNRAPALDAPSVLQALVGQALEFDAIAVDADLPLNGRHFSLIDAPEGARIDSDTGAFRWTPTAQQAGSASFEIIVTDDGEPPLSASVQVQVQVRGEGGLSIADVSVEEGNAGDTSVATFTVTLSIASAQTVAVAYVVLRDSAQDDPIEGERDFVGVPLHLAGALVFAPGQTSQVIQVPLLGDNGYEPDERFTVQLFAPTNTRLDDAEANGLILNDDPLPVIRADAVTTVEGPGAQALVRLYADQFRDLPITVAYSTADGSAEAGSDFVPASGTLVFANGEAWLGIDLADDAVVEGNENFFVDLSDPQGATLGTTHIEVTVIDDDSPARLSVADVQRSEGTGVPTPQGAMQFVVSLNRAATGSVTLDYSTLDGSATGITWNGSFPLPVPSAERDYVSTSGSLNFAPGETQKLITVYLGPDAVHEGDEDFFLQLSNIQGPVQVDDALARGLIVDDESRPVLSVADVTVYEPDSGSGEALFHISLSNASALPVSVDVATQDGSALAGSDYAAASGTVVIAPGELEAWVAVAVLADGAPEAAESFNLQLGNVAGADAGDLLGMATILDQPLLLAGTAAVAEGDSGDSSSLVFAFTLSRPALADVSFDWYTIGGSAGEDEDFSYGAGAAVIPAGQLGTTVTVQVNGDDTAERDEDLYLVVEGLQGARLADGAEPFAFFGRILNDDAVTNVAIGDVQLTEGAPGSQTLATFTVTLSGDLPTDTLILEWYTVPGTAQDGRAGDGSDDFAFSSGTLTFEPGGATTAQIEVPVIGDDSQETDEDFFVELVPALGALLLDGQGRALIVDDEPGPVLLVGDVQELEGAGGARTLQIYVGLDNLPLDPASLSWTTADGSATADTDYVAASGTLDLAEGFGLIEITVNGDEIAEADERFMIRFSDAQGIQVFDDDIEVTLIDDDGISTFSVSDAYAEEGTGGLEVRSAIFTVTRTGSTLLQQSVDLNTINGSATGVNWDGSFPPPEPSSDRDYVSLQDTLVFAPGQRQAQVVVYIGPDDVYEGNESFTLQLSNPSNDAALGDATGLATIEDDEFAPYVYLSGGLLQEPADGETAEALFTLSLSAPSALPVTVAYSTTDGSATEGSDYLPISGSVTIAPGATFTTLPVLVYGDAGLEGYESFDLLITGVTGGVAGQGQASFGISDLPTLSSAPATAMEGGSGDANSLDFVLTLSQAIPQDVTVTVQTASGTAWGGSDFVGLSDQTVSIPAGQTQVTVSVPVLGDNQQELDENLYLLLYNAVNASFPELAGGLQIEGLIDDDDPGPLLAISDVVIDEGPSGEIRSAVFEVTLQGPPATEPVTVNWTTQANLADAYSDFLPGNGSLVFETGITSQQITVEIYGDGEFEPDEDFQVLLYDATGALILDDRATATIVNDDDPVPPMIYFVAGSTREGDAGNTSIEIDFTLSDTPNETITVNYLIGAEGDAATAGEDYAVAGGLSGILTFTPTQLRAGIVVDIVGDTTSEPDEFFTVSLSNPTNAVLLDTQLSWAILDDDTPVELSVGDSSVFEGDLSLEALRDALSGNNDPSLAFEQLIETYLLDRGNLDQELPPYLGLLSFIGIGIDVAVAVVELSLSRPALDTVTVDFSTEDGSARSVVWDFNLASPPLTGPDIDYIVTDGRVIFEPGQQTRTVTVLLAPDTVLEADETFTLVVTNIDGATLADGTGQVTLRADEGFSVAPATSPEPAAGDTASLVFTVSLPGPTTQAVSVSYSTADGSGSYGAQAGIDYASVSGTLIFAPGEQSKQVEVPVLADQQAFEGVETLWLVLSDPVGAPLVVSEALGSIADYATLTVDDAQVVEGDEGTVELVFEVSLSAPVAPGRTVELLYGSLEVSAQAGVDFAYVFDNLLLTEGQQQAQIRVQVQGDTVYEGDETLVLQVGTLLDGDLFDTAEALGTIIDDEPVLRVLPSQVVEGDDGQTLALFTLRLNVALPEDLSFSYGTEDDSARAGEDYLAVGGTAMLAAGQTELTLAVPVLGDTAYDGDESFLFTVGGLSDPTVALPEHFATGTIVDDDRAVWMSDPVVTESTEGYRAAVFTVHLVGAAPDEGATLQFETVDGSALAGLDYVAMSGSLEIAPGQTSLQFTIPVIGDTQLEPDETFRVQLTAEAGVQVLDIGGTAFIEDSFPALSIGDAQAVESIFSSTLVFEITLSGAAPAGGVTVAYTAVGDRAIEGVDFASANGILIFEPGERVKTINVTMFDDGAPELTETLRVLLSDPQGAQILRGEGLGTLVDDEPPVQAYGVNNPVWAPESDGGVAVIVGLSAVVDFEVQVSWSTSGLSAITGVDYVEASGTLVFAPGQTEAVIELVLINDLVDEDPVEEFLLTLFDAVNAEVYGSPITIRITDDDMTPTVMAVGGSVVEGDEGNASLGFTISLSTPSDRAIRVSYATQGITAEADVDFVTTQGELIFAPGETEQQVQVPVIGDTLAETGDEYFSLQLAVLEGQAQTSLAVATGHIVDDDAPPLVTVDDLQALEGDVGNAQMFFTIRLSEASATPITVGYFTDSLTAFSGEDFLAAGGSVTFLPGETVKQILVPVLGDTVPELNEQFLLRLSLLSGSALLLDEAAVGTIVDDDAPLGAAASSSAFGEASPGDPEATPPSGDPTVRWSEERAPVIDWTAPRNLAAAPTPAEDWRRAFVSGALLGLA